MMRRELVSDDYFAKLKKHFKAGSPYNAHSYVPIPFTQRHCQSHSQSKKVQWRRVWLGRKERNHQQEEKWYFLTFLVEHWLQTLLTSCIMQWKQSSFPFNHSCRFLLSQLVCEFYIAYKGTNHILHLFCSVFKGQRFKSNVKCILN